MEKKNNEYYIKKADKIFENKYDYSLFDYIDNKTKVKIICPKHGIFEKLVDNHINKKQGCPKCSKPYKYTTEEIIYQFKSIHSDKYDYSLVEYINNRTKVKIICPKHGIFKQSTMKHKNGQNCPKCSKSYKYSTEEIISQFKSVHSDKYEYSLVDYISNNTKVKIICPKHGIFEQTPIKHKNGQKCPKCSKVFKYNTKEFIQECIKIHGDKYDYSLVEYINNRTKVKIICPKHGIFKQTPNNHLRNQGCPKCRKSKGEIEIEKYLNDKNIEYISQHQFDDCRFKYPLKFDFFIKKYNLCIEYDGLQHFKSIDFFGGDKKLRYRENNDMIKTEYCKKQGIKLIRISYNDDIVKTLDELF